MLPKVVAAQLADQISAFNGKRGQKELHAVALPVLRDALHRQFYSVCALSEADGTALDGTAASSTSDTRDDRRAKSTVFELPLYTKYLREFDLLPHWSDNRPYGSAQPCLRTNLQAVLATFKKP